MTHTHADGCPCKKHKKKRVVRSKVLRHAPIVGRPMPLQAQTPSFSFAMPSLPTPHVHLTTNQIMKEVDSFGPGKVGVVGFKTQGQSHIETKNAETQHSVAAPPVKISVGTSPRLNIRESKSVGTEREMKTTEVQTEPVQVGTKHTLEGLYRELAMGKYIVTTSGRKGTAIGPAVADIEEVHQDIAAMLPPVEKKS